MTSNNQCKICQKFIIADTANYCSSHCKSLDSRLYYSKNSLIFLLFIMGMFIGYSVLKSVELIYVGMTVSGVMLIGIIPVYQYYQSLRIEQKLKLVYNQNSRKYHDEEVENQPVYIYLYISRHTEPMISDEDYSEFV